MQIGGVQGKLRTPFIFEHQPNYKNTWTFHPEYLASLEEAREIQVTQKVDGECYYLDQSGKWWGRRDLRINKKFRKGKLTQEHFDETWRLKKLNDPYWIDWKPSCPPDLIGGHWFGWLPVVNGREKGKQAGKKEKGEFKYALEAIRNGMDNDSEWVLNTTYELIGPKIQGNPYGLTDHRMILHGSWKFKTIDVNQLKTVSDIQKVFLNNPEMLAAEGLVLWLDGIPYWKLHHGHIHDGEQQKAWRNKNLLSNFS